MSNFDAFRVNTPAVVHEVFDNEIVVIHLDSGNYYTLDQGGAQIWQLLQQGVTQTTLIETLAQADSAAAPSIASEVNQFLDKLQREALIVPTVADNNQSVSPPSAPFHSAALRKYTDLQDLLFLDPIHDVEETGWPNEKRA